ncbi:MAG: efflux RND transporter periplasmic adaptor subunit [Planctomycetaceae bacterium]
MNEQNKAPAAHFAGKFSAIREKVSYVVVILILCGILKLGHMTHWTFQFGGHEHAEAGHAKPHSDEAGVDGHEEVSEPKESEVIASEARSLNGVEVSVTEAGLAKAGIEVASVEKSPIQEELTTNAIVEYDQNARAQLSSRAPGYVWKVVRRVGEQVKKGEVLVIIDSSIVGESKADLLQEIVLLDLKNAHYKRLREIQDGVAGRIVLEAEMEVRLADIKARNAAQKLVNLGLPLNFDELLAMPVEQRSKYLQFLGIPSSLTEKLDPKTATANLIPLFAPFDGVLIGHEICMGEAVSVDAPFLEMADIRQMWVMMEIRKEFTGQIQIGQPVRFDADGIAGSVAGKIDWISSEVDPKTRTLRARAQVVNPMVKMDDDMEGERLLLRANSYGTGKIRIRDSMTALVVPREAVQFTGSTSFVFVKETSGFKRVDVEIGVVLEDQVEVLKGLKEGDVVATTGSHVLKAEMQIASAQ